MWLVSVTITPEDVALIWNCSNYPGACLEGCVLNVNITRRVGIAITVKKVISVTPKDPSRITKLASRVTAIRLERPEKYVTKLMDSVRAKTV